MLLQAASFSIAGGVADRLLQDYNRRLISDLGMMTRRDIKKKDIVDLRPLFDLKQIPEWQAPNPNLDFEDRLYVTQDYYYCYIPCFEEGVYHVNAGRYIYWKLKRLDLANHRMTLFLQDFIYYAESSGWQPGIYGDITWQFEDPEHALENALASKTPMPCDFKPAPDAVVNYVQMYKLINIRKLNWNANDRKNWKNIVMKNAQNGCDVMLQKTGSDNLNSLAAMFTSYTLKTNRILSEHKAAGRSQPVSDQEHHEYTEQKKAAVQISEKPPKERRIRTIGPIQIVSRDQPKPGRRAMANYTKASWETRAHFRTLKSGKKIYVRKSIHKRKALIEQDIPDQTPAKTPLTIRIMPQNQDGDKNKDGEKT